MLNLASVSRVGPGTRANSSRTPCLRKSSVTSSSSRQAVESTDTMRQQSMTIASKPSPGTRAEPGSLVHQSGAVEGSDCADSVAGESV